MSPPLLTTAPTPTAPSQSSLPPLPAMSSPSLTPSYNQVTKETLPFLQPFIVSILKRATFIALDTEFTGLGSDPQKTRVADIQERYTNLVDLSKTHALIAMGLSVFIQKESSSSSSSSKGMKGNGGKQVFEVHNFNFSLLSSQEFMVSPKSMVFLVDNGVDMNQWIREGIPYQGGSNEATGGAAVGNNNNNNNNKNQQGLGLGGSTFIKNEPNAILRSLFKCIMTRRVPVVVHNGFLDLVFLYHSFYAALPQKLGTFVADLSDMFPGGIYDTKYVSDFMTREKVSFLSYLFRKYERAEKVQRMRIEQGDHHDQSKKQQSAAVRAAASCYSVFDVQSRIEIGSQQPNGQEQNGGSHNGGGNGKRKRNKNGHHYRNSETESIGGDDSNGNSKGHKRRVSLEFCQNYALHGFCKLNQKCGKSHSLDMILDHEERIEEQERERKQAKKQKKPPTDTLSTAAAAAINNKEEPTVDSPVTNITESVKPSLSSTETTSTTIMNGASSSSTNPSTTPSSSTTSTSTTNQFHSAYFDAFMTGTIFSHQLNEHGGLSSLESLARNQIYLIGKSIPLKIEKSAFAKYSDQHLRQSQI